MGGLQHPCDPNKDKRINGWSLHVKFFDLVKKGKVNIIFNSNKWVKMVSSVFHCWNWLLHLTYGRKNNIKVTNDSQHMGTSKSERDHLQNCSETSCDMGCGE